MRVSLVDPSAFTPPYDRALAAALAAQGADVELLTSRFLHGPVPEADDYRVVEAFYRRTSDRGLDAAGRRAFKAVEHLGDMARLRGRLSAADVVHYQWLTFPALDRVLLPRKRPRVMTAHYVLPPEPSRAQLEVARRTFGAMDAVIAHTESGARRLRDEARVEPGRVHVIPHGAFDYLTRLPVEKPLPAELEGAESPVVLFFGLLRPYKGIEDLLRGFAGIEGAELWIVGNPRMSTAPLHELAAAAAGRVRFVERFVDDAEIPAIFRRADLVALPYRDAEQSGVLYTALAFGKPMVVTDVGGLGELGGRDGVARVVPPASPDALGAAISELLADESARAELTEAAENGAAGRYSWTDVARRTVAVYDELMAR